VGNVSWLFKEQKTGVKNLCGFQEEAGLHVKNLRISLSACQVRLIRNAGR